MQKQNFEIKAVNHPGVKHINGDVYHMQTEEPHIGEALYGKPNKELLDNLVQQTARYFREREEVLIRET